MRKKERKGERKGHTCGPWCSARQALTGCLAAVGVNAWRRRLHSCAHNCAPTISGRSLTIKNPPFSPSGRATGRPINAARRADSCAGDAISTFNAAATAAISGIHTLPLDLARVEHNPAQNWADAWRWGVI